MKQLILILLAVLLFTGCAAAADSEETTLPTAQTTPTLISTETPAPELLSFRIYLPNSNADGFDVETVQAEQITPEVLLTELQMRNVLSEDVRINDFKTDGKQITLDFNQAFADQLCSTGTAGEMMLTGSIVNTFLDAFQTESLLFTVDGGVLESGHVVYDFPLEFTN